jgi:hypothetical protein
MRSFTAGFETADLKIAADVLARLADSGGRRSSRKADQAVDTEAVRAGWNNLAGADSC